MKYLLKIKQVVDCPRCRIYREFIRTLMEDKDIRTNESSYLFYYLMLCSNANFRSSYRRLDGISYLIGPGERICKPAELSEWFRTRFQHQAVSILENLQKQNYITYSRIGRGNLIKFNIISWQKHNTALKYNYPCRRDQGVFFFPVAAIHELISIGKCSEMDIILDLWLHAIYNDEQVKGSELGPVVYFRNYTGNPLTNYSDLALRWGLSREAVSRILDEFQDKGYISLVPYYGKHGSVIYLRNYLSTIFNISDVMLDKEEVSMSFQIPIFLSEDILESDISTVYDEQITILNEVPCVPDSHIKTMVKKVAQILTAQGITCCECPKTLYKLYTLSDSEKDIIKYSLQIRCPDNRVEYQFEFNIIH